MKQRVVFLFYHGLGHINAFLKVGQMLEDAHHEVYFAGNGFFQKHISLQKFKFYLLKTHPFGMGFESWVNRQKKKKGVYLSALRDRITDTLYNEREVELFWMLEDLKPALVLIDSLQTTDFIVLYSRLMHRGIKVAIVHTLLPTQVIPGLPPLNSDVFPEDTASIKKAIWEMKLAKLTKTWWRKMIWLGFDDVYIINRRLKKNGVPKRYISTSLSLQNFPVTQLDEFILAPREFDFPQLNPGATHSYIGFMAALDRNVLLEPDHQKAIADIQNLRTNGHLKFVYCSFGTIEPKKKKAMFSFLKKLLQVMIDENYVLLMSLNADPSEISLLPAHKNIYIFKSFPQLEILKIADVFITHGGLNSIKESIHAEVPMLVYPIHPEYDPTGNAARVAYHALGLRGQMTIDTYDDIKGKIHELLFNSEYKTKILALKQKDACYTSEQFIDRVHALKPLPSRP